MSPPRNIRFPHLRGRIYVPIISDQPNPDPVTSTEQWAINLVILAAWCAILGYALSRS